MLTHRYQTSLLLALLLGACTSDPREGGRSFVLHDRYVIMHMGSANGRMRYVVVESWPADSTPDERMRDTRVRETGTTLLVLQPDGSYVSVDTQPQFWFFDGAALTHFPIQMTEAEFFELRPEDLRTYAQLLELFAPYRMRA